MELVLPVTQSRKLSKLRIISIVIILIISALRADGKDSVFSTHTAHKLSGEVHSFHNIASHGYYRGVNPSGKAIAYGNSYHLKYSYTLPGTYQGAGIAYNTFYAPDLVGSPVSLYLFQGTRLANISQKLSFGYEWNLGLSGGWKSNVVINSNCNIYINVRLPFTWKISPEWEMIAGPQYTHFSNGDTRYPNGGANTFGLYVGVSHIWGEEPATTLGKDVFTADKDLKNTGIKDRLHYDIMIFGAWRAARIKNGHEVILINKTFLLGGASFNALYKLNKHIYVGPSLDIQTDSSSGLYLDGTDYRSPGSLKQTSCGVSINGELEMPVFSINIGAGYNFIKNSGEQKKFYTTYKLKAPVSSKMYICMGYRLSAAQYTHNLMFGIGWKI